VLLNLWGATTCKRGSQHAPRRSGSERSPETTAAGRERREAANRRKAAIQRAGGADVWVKGESSGRDGSVVEALAESAAFDPALAAVRAESRAQHLEIRVRTKPSSGGLRVVEADLGRGRQSIGKWRLREVRQLL